MKKAVQILIIPAFLLTFIVTKQLNVMQDTEEIWRDVPEYIGHYQISTTGLIRSLSKTITCKDGSKKHLTGKLLAPRYNPSGYLQTVLSKCGVVRYHYIHRLVAMAFIPNPLNLPQVNHLNKIKNDNRVENLEWIYPRENVSHSKSNKTSKYTGVSFFNPLGYIPKKRWVSHVMINGKVITIGTFSSQEEASDAYKKALEINGLYNKYA